MITVSAYFLTYLHLASERLLRDLGKWISSLADFDLLAILV